MQGGQNYWTIRIMTKETEQKEPKRLSTSEIMEAMEVALAAPMKGTPGVEECLWGLPMNIEGDFGIGKTSRWRQVAQKLTADLCSLFAGQHPPEDFAGALIPDGKGDAKQICSLSQVRDLLPKKYGIIFIDEANGAPPATQAALMSFVHERVAGDHPIPPHIRIVSATNPEEVATAGHRFSPGLANRFVHFYDSVPSAEDWTGWFLGSTVKKKGESTLQELEKKIVSGWPNVWPRMQATYSGFIQANEELLHKRPPPENPQSGAAWPSPRTWDFAARGQASAIILNKSSEIEYSFVEGAVGPAAAENFEEYCAQFNLPSVDEVLNGTWKIDKSRIDITMAAFVQMTSTIVQKKDEAEKHRMAALAWKRYEDLLKAQLADIAMPQVTTMVGADLGRASKDANVKKAASPVLSALSLSGMGKFIDE